MQAQQSVNQAWSKVQNDNGPSPVKGLLEIHETEEEHAASPCPGRRDMSDESSFEASDSDSPGKVNDNQENVPNVCGIEVSDF